MCTVYFGSVKISLCVPCTLVLSRYLYVYCVLWFCQDTSMCTVYFGSVKISLCVLCTLVLSRYLYVYSAGITLAQNFRATSRLRPGHLERCFSKQGDSRLHVAAVLTR